MIVSLAGLDQTAWIHAPKGRLGKIAPRSASVSTVEHPAIQQMDTVYVLLGIRATTVTKVSLITQELNCCIPGKEKDAFLNFPFVECAYGTYGEDCQAVCECDDTCACDPVSGNCTIRGRYPNLWQGKMC